MVNLAVYQLSGAQSVAQNATEYSNSVEFSRTTGDATVLVISSAGSITVTQQCSLDNITWYDAVNTANSALGAVAATMTVGSRYVVVTPVQAPWIRYKIVEGNSAATVVTVWITFGEDLGG